MVQFYAGYDVNALYWGAVNQPRQPAQLANPRLKTSDPADPVPHKPEHMSLGLANWAGCLGWLTILPGSVRNISCVRY